MVGKIVIAEEEMEEENQEVVLEDLEDVKKYVSEIEDYAISPWEFTDEGIKDWLMATFPVSDDDPEQNSESYIGLKEFSFSDYVNDLDHDSLEEFYKERFEDYVDDEYSEVEFDLESSNWQDIESELFEIATNSSEVEEDFDNVLNKYIEENETEWGFNTNGDYDYQEEIEEEAEQSVSLSDVAELDDEVGDSTEIDSTVDYDTRDTAFIYLDGEIHESNSGESHAQILQRILEEEGRGDEVPENIKNNPMNNSRPSMNRMKRLTNTEDVAFGHIVDGCAFIEVLSGGATLDEVANACAEDYDKVYHYSPNQNMIKRVANKLNMDDIAKTYGFKKFSIKGMNKEVLLGKYLMINFETGYPKVDVAVSAEFVDDINEEELDDELMKAIMLCKALGQAKLIG